MGISWAVDANPSQVYDMPPRPELSSRGTIVNREKDQVAHYYRDAQRYPSQFMNESSYRTSEGGSSRDPRISHYQSSTRESTRGSHSNYSSHAGSHHRLQPSVHRYPIKQPDFYSRSTHHSSPTSSVSSSDRYESPTPMPQKQSGRQDKGKVSSKSVAGSSGFDNDRYDTSHRNEDRPKISSRETSREPLRESSKEPTAAQVAKWVSASPKDSRQLAKFACGKGGILKNGPKTLAERENFAQAIEKDEISWEAPMVLAVDFVYDVPVFPSPSVSTLKKSAPPPPTSGDEERSHKKSRIEPTSTEYERGSSKHLSYDRSKDDLENNSSRNSNIEPSSKLAASSNGSVSGNADAHVGRISATTSASAAVPTSSTDLVQVSIHRKIKNTITVINAILEDGGYCYMPYRAFEKSYDRLRVNMSPAMTGAELNHALQSDLQTEVSSHVVLTMFPGNPLARYIRLKVRDIQHRRSQEDDHTEAFRRRFLSEASKIVFPGTIISIHALVYLMESLRPDPLSDAAVRHRLGQVDLYDFLISSSSAWDAHHMGHFDRELVAFNPPKPPHV
ncbi:hypothetical protein K450DRAFT_257056 [Umbelopsis ramanniana AG]|uniref:Uncharacterized protein n=1 Tax=Umbelopsis ramanniana AG TaxID=1314678 RepID=A0AAD5E452_UMBRA|nr:uncharacterized protein K450DRAFT_257056 [Umbelopsis ramanniana AG]KAI8576387.1 hypothetical protein K450DRAFT_257056 [Umbelopsis ramanniana AG]